MPNNMDYLIKINKNCGLIVLEIDPSFISVFKSIAIPAGISPSDISNITGDLAVEILANHSIVIMCPIFNSPEEQIDFINKNKNILINTVINSWNFPNHLWPKDEIESNFDSFFTITYFDSIIDVFNDSEEDFKKIDGLSLFIVKPKKIIIDWFQRLYLQKKILISNNDILNPVLLQMIGRTCSIAPQFATKEEADVFIKQNYSRLFDFALAKFCDDDSLWINNRTYELFLQCFDCYNYAPIFTQKHWQS